MEILNAIALTMLKPQMSPLQLMQLYQEAGSATAIVENRKHIENVIPEATPHLKQMLSGLDDALALAEQELKFCEAHSIKALHFGDENYPQRLTHCEDAPLVLYFCGNGNLNPSKVISIIGTRQCTVYGQDIIRHFIEDLHETNPDILVISGLAYGVDIQAHRNALKVGMDTVGVLAHGLDSIYPSIHRNTAKEMIAHGGLLSEYPHGTRPEKRNFVQRNRIVAGMSDATILVESAAKGGGLITCDIANSYSRDVFAFPGAVNAPYSAGCNNLIRKQGAQLITSAEDFITEMNWNSNLILEKAKNKGIERELFPEFSPDETLIVEALKERDLHVNEIAIRTNLPIGTINSALFMLEMNGVVISMAGGSYHLLS